ncbi:aminocarboxymuconate-semialdehyde decarboxylase [Pusillimonas noertemannii]|uniref:Aminocarboxymuconate-semialdehyde decarboxylase n=1 Tax=Pusillimonas noertemannii TaxID=305977 RepID=A0A2U1CT10_9BURK|nr:aminocarboxymuconate-semialdehyde decarboxylase [Pusillimonas noertemannii]
MHTCSPTCHHDPSVRRARGPGLTVDFHCHLFDSQVEELVAPLPQKAAELEMLARTQGEAACRHNNEVMFPSAFRRMESLEERLGDMDAMGVDIQVLSPSPTQYYYWADERLAEELSGILNERIARACSLHPQRLKGIGSVALQHPRLAVEQLHHAVEKLGLCGVEVSSLIAGKDLVDSSLEPFWAAAEKLGCVVFLHPLGTTLGERLATHYLSNIVGQPLETTIALTKMIFEGVFERFPRLRILAAHGGGFLASYSGRALHGAAARPDVGRGTGKAVFDCLRRNVWFDTVVYDPRILRHLIETFGANRLVVGTDYPFDMGSYNVHELIDAIPSITKDERAMILGENALDLLGMAVSPRH